MNQRAEYRARIFYLLRSILAMVKPVTVDVFPVERKQIDTDCRHTEPSQPGYH